MWHLPLLPILSENPTHPTFWLCPYLPNTSISFGVIFCFCYLSSVVFLIVTQLVWGFKYKLLTNTCARGCRFAFWACCSWHCQFYELLVSSSAGPETLCLTSACSQNSWACALDSWYWLQLASCWVLGCAEPGPPITVFCLNSFLVI